MASPRRQTRTFLCGCRGLEDRLINSGGRFNPQDTMYGKRILTSSHESLCGYMLLCGYVDFVDFIMSLLCKPILVQSHNTIYVAPPRE